MKKLLVTIAVMAVVGGLYAQQNDTIASAKVDTVNPKQTMELQEVGVTAKKPVYMTDGEKTLYNVSEDPLSTHTILSPDSCRCNCRNMLIYCSFSSIFVAIKRRFMERGLRNRLYKTYCFQFFCKVLDAKLDLFSLFTARFVNSCRIMP